MNLVNQSNILPILKQRTQSSDIYIEQVRKTHKVQQKILTFSPTACSNLLYGFKYIPLLSQ